VLSYFLLRGGGRQEPSLKDGIENPEVSADVLQEADKTSKTSTGLIITSVVLGIGLAVSLLANVGLGWMLWKKPPSLEPEVEKPKLDTSDPEFEAAWTSLQNAHPEKIAVVARAFTEELRNARLTVTKYLNILIKHGLAKEAGIEIDEKI